MAPYVIHKRFLTHNQHENKQTRWDSEFERIVVFCCWGNSNWLRKRDEKREEIKKWDKKITFIKKVISFVSSSKTRSKNRSGSFKMLNISSEAITIIWYVIHTNIYCKVPLMSLKYKVKKENPKWNIKNHKKNCDTATRKAKATIQPISIVWYACACLMPQTRMKSRKQMKKNHSCCRIKYTIFMWNNVFVKYTHRLHD